MSALAYVICPPGKRHSMIEELEVSWCVSEEVMCVDLDFSDRSERQGSPFGCGPNYRFFEINA